MQKAIDNQPYKGLSIIHGIPFTPQTIIKLEVLYRGGANLIVTSPSFMDVDEALVSEFIDSGGLFLRNIPQKLYVDICLDCAGELINKVQPKLGSIEITGTGTNKYKNTKLNYPVISVDMCKIKELEAVLGTGEAFVRSFVEITNEDITDKKFMLIGFGKVGKGIAKNLERYTKRIWVVDKKQENLNNASKNGFTPLDAKDIKSINKIAKEMFCVVAATGIKNVISDNYDAKCFKAKYLANMGGEDEFGYKFDKNIIMCKGKPINFFVKNPTLMKYLDPVFLLTTWGLNFLLIISLKMDCIHFLRVFHQKLFMSGKKFIKRK